EIEKGDSYELCYWLNGWVSMGRQVADKNYLVYDRAPSNALFLLHDLSKGRQERIFTYQNNQQVWW
ncbi:MAG TPA: hypothetical protein VE035_08095, partial [Puia sp.]|nr:hypothetical protein [Puia sp.]